MQELKILIKQLIKKVDLCFNRIKKTKGDKIMKQDNKQQELTILDVANYIIKRCKEKQINDLTNMKLQKLIYYAFAKYSVDNSKDVTNLNVLTEDRFEAWPYGPVIPYLYFKFQDFKHEPLSIHPDGDAEKINEIKCLQQKKAVDDIINLYGKVTACDLSYQTHQEDPWSDVNKDLCFFDNETMSNEVIFNYYTTFGFENFI